MITPLLNWTVERMAVNRMVNIKRALKPLIPDSLLSARARQRARQHFRQHLRPTDVFLVGHPKSGNTWLAYMLGIVLRERFAPHQITLANIQDFVPAFHARDHQIAEYANHPDPRIFRNEGPVHPELYPKSIYILRDPRAALVSYYHHCVHDAPEYPWKLDDFIDEIMAYGCIRRAEPHLIRWDKQVLLWIERAKRQPVKMVRYEDMHQDRGKVLREVVEFVGIDCPPADLDLAVERSSFENMRENEQTFGAEPYSGTKGERGFFTRRGKVDGWKDELTPLLVQRIEHEFAEAMRATGYV
jgi:hypothetical protein